MVTIIIEPGEALEIRVKNSDTRVKVEYRTELLQVKVFPEGTGTAAKEVNVEVGNDMPHHSPLLYEDYGD